MSERCETRFFTAGTAIALGVVLVSVSIWHVFPVLADYKLAIGFIAGWTLQLVGNGPHLWQQGRTEEPRE